MFNISILGFSLYQIVFYFFIYSFLGWCVEVAYAYYNRKYFVNRGFLYGPFCPIYGSGVLSLVLLLDNFKNNIVLLFVLATVLTSALEYITAVILENVFKAKWWDYTEDPFNIKGRICLHFSLIWGAAGLVVVKFIHPAIDGLISLIPTHIGSILFYGVIIYFIVDFAFTLSSLIEFNKLLAKLQNDKGGFKEMYLNFLSSTKKKATSKSKDLSSKFKGMKDMKLNHIRLIYSFPDVKSIKFDNILKMIKDKLFSKND
ncbi:MAG: putative ABC transporter permease [Clostridium sp.]